MQVNGTEAATTRQARWLPRVGELLHLDTEAGPVLYRVAKAKPMGVLLRPVPRDEVAAIQAEHRAAQVAFAVEVTGAACTMVAACLIELALRTAAAISEGAAAAARIDDVVERMIAGRERPGFWARLLRRR